MKQLIIRIIRKIGFSIERIPEKFEEAEDLYQKYKDFTMIPKQVYIDNLLLAANYANIEGCIVECGVWRGGMSSGMAEMLPRRKVYLFDSFEGLPEAKEIDGEAAIAWQKNIEGPWYFDNCKAEMDYAEKAMKQTNSEFKLIKGWFNETLPKARFEEPIAILRLDADWYDSTIDCLKNLYPKVKKGGLIIFDDYYAWDGCSKAVHDYLSEIKSITRIKQTPLGVAYLVKKD